MKLGASGPPGAGPRRWHERVWARVLGSLVALGALAFALLWYRCGLSGCPNVDILRDYVPNEASIVLDRDGREISELYITRRTAVPIDSIPKVVQDAFVAIEDRRFWQHHGVDWRRVIGAMWSNVKSLGIEEGSSTITMQLARNIFPERLPGSERTPLRKLGEARVAKAIEDRYTKKEILALYLNQIYFGSGAYGIEAAAQEYFGKSASQLDLSEAAMLAALPRAPSRLNPRVNLAAALKGREEVLGRMRAQGLISADAAAAAAAAKLNLVEEEDRSTANAPYFVETVRRQLEQQLGDAIYTQGYAIHTTLDLNVQRILEDELARQARDIEAGRFGAFRHPTYASVHDDGEQPSGGTPYLQTAGIVMEARTGDVLALVGGRDFDDSWFNRATQAMRQPGSAFKPFVYAAAFQAGYPPTYRIADEPIEITLADGKIWEPHNYDDTYSGEVTLREGLVHSKNVVAVRLATQIGLGEVARIATQAGLGDRFVPNPSVVLGTAEVTPLELTAAYAGFATLGMRPEPRFVTRVQDRAGRTVYEQPQSARLAFDPSVAFLTTSLMQDVVNRGTGTAVRAAGFTGPAAGKTGTTQDAADAWFVGFTPELVATIWFGLDERKTIVRGATGGELAAPVWGRVMRRIGPAHAGWTPPANVEEYPADEYGNVVTDQCPGFGTIRTEYFLRGTAPVGQCVYGRPGNAGSWWRRGRDTVWLPRFQPPIDTAPERESIPDPPRRRENRIRFDTLRVGRDTVIVRRPVEPADTLPATTDDTIHDPRFPLTRPAPRHHSSRPPLPGR